MTNLKDKKKEILSKVLSNIKLQNAGVKRKERSEDISSESFNKVNYPSLGLSVEEVPQLKEYDVGDKVIFIMEAQVVGHRRIDNLKRTRESFDFDLKRIGCKNKGA